MTKNITKKKSGFKALIIALLIITGVYMFAFFYGKNIIQKANDTNTNQDTNIQQDTKIINKKTIHKVCFSGHGQNPCFNVKIANTDETRRKGLMFVEQLPENEGMLFIYDEEGNYNFWMKNTLIPLDMIWIDKNNKIVDIQTAQPCKADPCPSYISAGKAKYVLEINGELSKNLLIHTGSTTNYL